MGSGVASCCWFGVWESSATTTGGGAGDFRDEFENECGEDVQRFGIRVLHFHIGDLVMMR